MYDQLGQVAAQEQNPFALHSWSGPSAQLVPVQNGGELAADPGYAPVGTELPSGGHQAPPTEDYTLIYVGAGAAALIGVALLYRSFKKGKRR